MDETKIERIASLSSHGVFRDLAFALLFLLFGGGITCFALFGAFFRAGSIPNWGWIALALISICAMNVSLAMWLVYCFTVRRAVDD
jgi:ABC-type uncharacterized transport system permease subunit